MANPDWRDDVKSFFDFRNPGADPNWREDAHSDIKEMMGFGRDQSSVPTPTMLNPNAGLFKSDNPRAGRDNWNQDPQFAQDQIDIANLMPGSPEYQMMLNRMGAKLGKKSQAPASTTPGTTQTPTTSSDQAEANRLAAMGAQGRSPTQTATSPGATSSSQTSTNPSASTSTPSATTPSSNQFSPERIGQMEKDLIDLLNMRPPTDKDALNQWRNLIEIKRKELGVAKQAHRPLGMGANYDMGKAREEERQTTNHKKTDDEAKKVLFHAEQYWKQKGEAMPPNFLKDQGFTADGHKIANNMFTQKDVVTKKKADKETLTKLIKAGMLGGIPGMSTNMGQGGTGPELGKPQPNRDASGNPQLKPPQQNTNNSSMDATKSQLKQMYEAGFIPEASFRRGMNDPYSQKQLIESVYDQYVKRL
jgi:hypothetical protein